MSKGQRSRGRRQGNVFALRLTPEQRAELEALCARDTGPRKLGPWLLWRALGNAARVGNAAPGRVIPELGQYPSAGNTNETPRSERLILDLCAGSGAWSEPYRAAGYTVCRVTLPALDVRTFRPPPVKVWGVLAAPPCTEFSLAKNGRERDFVAGLETVNACMRLVLQTRPRWWALENPIGLLGRWLGRPRCVFEPHQFGDPWTKRTALWGEFEPPTDGPFVEPIDGGGPLCSVCYPDDPHACSLAEHRAVTPPGFARAFFEANQ